MRDPVRHPVLHLSWGRLPIIPHPGNSTFSWDLPLSTCLAVSDKFFDAFLLFMREAVSAPTP